MEDNCFTMLLVPAIQHHESALSVHIASPSWASLPPSPYPTSLGCHPALHWAPCVLQQLLLAVCFIYGNVYFQCYALHLSHPLLPLLCQVCSVCLCLYSCPANWITGTIFLDSVYMCYMQYFFFSLSDLLYSVTGSRFIHLSSTDSNSLFFMTE